MDDPATTGERNTLITTQSEALCCLCRFIILDIYLFVRILLFCASFYCVTTRGEPGCVGVKSSGRGCRFSRQSDTLKTDVQRHVTFLCMLKQMHRKCKAQEGFCQWKKVGTPLASPSLSHCDNICRENPLMFKRETFRIRMGH